MILSSLALTCLSEGEEPGQRFEQLVAEGIVVGAQLVTINPQGETTLRHFGALRTGAGAAPVKDDSIFLIGSCSKPFAAACILSLIDDPKLDLRLDSSIDRWLPAFKAPRVADRLETVRAPTVEELLSHRAGVYSQRDGMTKEQAKWIRQFSHPLSEAVAGIARFPLATAPGERYAYSGAGYCIAGRLAEVAAGRSDRSTGPHKGRLRWRPDHSWEALLQERICKPIGLRRTTYFPSKTFPDEVIATGLQRRQAPHRLGARHQMPLVGGSLYSTAAEMAKFGRAVAVQWKGGPQQNGKLPISRASLGEFAKARTPRTGYSIGWKVTGTGLNQPTRLSHSGALQSYRARLAVDLESGAVVAACWTLGVATGGPDLARHIDATLADE